MRTFYFNSSKPMGGQLMLALLLCCSIALVSCVRGSRPRSFAKVTSAPTGRALAECQQKLGAMKVGGRDEKVKTQNSLCVFDAKAYAELSPEQQRQVREAPFPLGMAYRVPEKPFNVRFEVSNSIEDGEKQKSQKLRRPPTLVLRLRLRISGEPSKEVISRTENYIQTTCAEKIRTLWRKSRSGLTFDIRTTIDPSEPYDRMLDLHPALDEQPRGPIAGHTTDKNSHEEAPHLVMASFPFHSDFFPLSHPRCVSACRERDGEEQSDCEQQCSLRINEPFCQSLAKLTAHWVGVKDPAVATNCQLGEDGRHPLDGTHSIALGYRKEGALINEPPQDGEEQNADVIAAQSNEPPKKANQSVTAENFWKAARVDEKEVLQVFAPLCKLKVR